MSETVIKVQNLSKRYRIGLKENQAETLAGQIGNIMKSPWGNFKRLRQLNRFGVEDESVFWALKDVNFEVKQGEVLGIIGKNGAGKSTLLKILSQIAEPTSGRIEIHGRVASLLEVGTGFHPELSGRDNIYMNGTILGMTRREIDSKLDEIIDFSGVEKFVDTPVKFYSSGMKVRLGFSVAAHLEPEILIIDEVLAVGDFEFQKKCLGKMEDVAGQGRTVIFVSHNMEAVRSLCSKAVYLNSGSLSFNGEVNKAINNYLQENGAFDIIDYSYQELKPTIMSIVLDIKELLNGGIKINVKFKSPFPIKNPVIGVVIYNQLDIPIYGSNGRYHPKNYSNVNIVEGEIVGHLNDSDLHTGIYKISVWLGDDHQDFDYKKNAVVFDYISNRGSLRKPDIQAIGSVDKIFNWKLIDYEN